MKSYVENARTNNQYKLVCQYNGISAKGLRKLIRGSTAVAYELPNKQTLESTWSFRLHLACGEVLGIELSKVAADPKSFIKAEIPIFRITNYSMLVYEEDDVYSESGICFLDPTGAELIVIAAPSPGAVSVSIPNIHEELKPECSMSDYKRKEAVNS